jgi:hypothetical protein
VSPALALVAAGLVTLAPAQLFTISAPAVVEASGIARGIAAPGVYYVQNDSGDSARFFAVDARTGAVRATYHVPGATNHDWEDLAVARDAAGTPSVWLADIGDNDAVRSEVQLYRVDEPHATSGGADTARPDVWRLRYPSGPVNAESLFVTPGGRAYIVTKVPSGHSVVYEVPAHPSRDRVQSLRRVGVFQVPTEGLSPGPQLLTTAAALSRDGSVLVVRTYLTAYVWRVRGLDIAAALRRRPVAVPLPLQRQGEGVCIVGDSLVVDSEGRDQPVWRVPLPAGVRAQVPSPPSAPRSARPSARPSAGSSSSNELVPEVVVGAVVLLLIALGALRMFRRR